MHEQVQIETADGACDAHVLRPDGKGPWPTVLMYQDGIGMRESLVEIASRIANDGYFVLLPNLFYRIGVGAHIADVKSFFNDPAARKVWIEQILAAATPEKVMSDTQSFLSYLGARPEAKAAKIGTTGYCMGGRMSFIASATFGERVACAAAFHPGGLATDKPDSPHLLAGKIRGEIYIAGAIEDPGFDDAQKARLTKALDDAGVKYTLETYPARHGWVPSDTPVHDPEQAERHYASLLSILSRSLS